MSAFLRRILQHPLTKGMNLDDPETTSLRRRIITEKPLLHDVYAGWSRDISRRVPEGPGEVLEIGCGAGLYKSFVPEVLSSDLQPVPGADVCCSALALPFARGSLKAVVGANVLHHVQDMDRFLEEAAFCVRPGGAMVFIEPWVSPLSRFVYSKLHHEPFDPAAESWRLPDAGPLSGGNNALPWIIFHRDAHELARRHPQWRLAHVEPQPGFAYLLSGGVSLRSLAPRSCNGLVRTLDAFCASRLRSMAMFCVLTLNRVGDS